MLVPKASMNEDNLPQPGKDHIGDTWQPLHVQAVPVTHPMHEATDYHLGFRVLALDT